MGVRNYRDLIAWQKAMEFVESIYKISQQFPVEERYSLTSQLRRSATSVPSNIAEGQGRFSNPDFKRFLSIAHGSLSEAETANTTCHRLRYLNEEESKPTLALAAEVGKLLHGLANSLDRS